MSTNENTHVYSAKEQARSNIHKLQAEYELNGLTETYLDRLKQFYDQVDEEFDISADTRVQVAETLEEFEFVDAYEALEEDIE